MEGGVCTAKPRPLAARAASSMHVVRVCLSITCAQQFFLSSFAGSMELLCGTARCCVPCMCVQRVGCRSKVSAML